MCVAGAVRCVRCVSGRCGAAGRHMFAAGTEAMPESYRFDTVKGDWFRQDREVVMDKRIAIVTGSAL